MQSAMLMFSRTVRMAFWVIYDHLGKLLAVNFVVLPVAVLPAAALMALFRTPVPVNSMLQVFILGGAVFLGGFAAFAALTACVCRLIDRADSSWTEWGALLGRVLRRSLMLGAPLYIAAAGLLGSAYVYLAQWSASLPWVGYPGGAVALWLLLLGAAAMHVLVPALGYPHASWWKPLRIAMVLTLDNPGFVLMISAVSAGMLALASMAPVLLLFYPLVWSALAGSGYELLARKYALAEGSPSVADEHDDYLNRGIQDFFFPWKG